MLPGLLCPWGSPGADGSGLAWACDGTCVPGAQEMSSLLLARGTPLSPGASPSPLVLIAEALEPYSVSVVREGVEGLLAVIRIRVESPGVGGLRWGLPRA